MRRNFPPTCSSHTDMKTTGAFKAQQKKSTKTKTLPDSEPQKRRTKSTRETVSAAPLQVANEESDPDLDNELDEENALNDLAGEQDLSTDDEDDQIEGFESDSDIDFAAALTLPSVPPKLTNREKKLAKRAAKAAVVTPLSKPGTIYLGHIPHGFFEPQMHSYFSQFGTITRLRLSRNRKTGKSKHFGWVEFTSKDVAEIVADTMDGYLIHPHRMVCKVVEVDDKVWKGANKVFKTIPWRRINKDKLESKRTKEEWEGLAKKEDERNRKREERIKEMGIDYEFPLRGEKRKVEDTEEIAQKKIKKTGKDKSKAKVTKKEKSKKVLT